MFLRSALAAIFLMPSNNDQPAGPQDSPIERPLRWRDLWRVFLPLAPWVSISFVLSLVLSPLGYGRWPWYILGAVILVSQIIVNILP
jgi:hypothetical protein